MNIEVNPRVLLWARESIALNKTNAAEQLDITLSRLSMLENGDKKPTLAELKQMSKAYKRTVATLLLKNIPKEKPLPPDRRTINSSEIGSFHDKTILAIRKARALAQSLLSLKEENKLPIKTFPYESKINDNPKILAQKIGEALNIKESRKIDNDNIAFEDYIEKVEQLGVAVFQLSLTQDGLRGFSIVDDVMPIIGIKRGESVTSKIFTLFHELGHIVLNEGGLCDIVLMPDVQRIEKWCNAFAAEILMPSDELLRNELVIKKSKASEKIWSKTELVEIGNVFHVGPLATLRRLLEHGLTTSEYYRNRHEAWNKPSFGRSKNPEGRNLAKETIKEKGRLYVNLAFNAYDQNKIDLKDLSDFLGVKLAYLPKTRQLLNSL